MRCILMRFRITQIECLPCYRVAAISQFLQQIWLEYKLFFKFHKPVSDTYRPEKCFFLSFNYVKFNFFISLQVEPR